MTKLIINSPAEALALREMVDAKITGIEFAKFRVTDTEIAALNLFIKNNWKSLAVIDLRSVLELNYGQLEGVSKTVLECSPSLEVVSVNVASLHGKSKGVSDIFQDPKLKEKCDIYQTFLSKNYPDFSKQNRTNFSVTMPQEYIALLDGLQRNLAIKNSAEFKLFSSLADASMEEDFIIDGRRSVEIFLRQFQEGNLEDRGGGIW